MSPHTILIAVVALVFSQPLFGAAIEPAADAPQPLSPEESQKRFRLPVGFEIQCVASEPHLSDPAAIAFDSRGRIFVCEIHGYNLEGHYDVQELNKTGVLDTKVQRIMATRESIERAEEGTYGTVKLLEDVDGDGRIDRSTIWADRLPPCYGVVAAREGVIVLCAPQIVYLADRDGDGRAEVRETLFTGFGVGELWTRINNPRWGVDNWIYAACGAGSAGTISGPRLKNTVALGNTGFRFKADGSQLEPVSGGTSGFGLALSDWGDRFLVSNQQHALYVAPLPYAYLARNPYSAAPNTVLNICSYGFPARVFPTAPPDPWRIARSQQPEWVKFYGADEATMGMMTAACAPLIYRADQFPPEYRDNHFSCDSAYNLVHRCVLEADGASFRAKRAGDDKVEFLTSTEQWFRPVNLEIGPDGALYVVDMYREIIEDYTAIPRDLQQRYGLIAGHDRGRIWRVRHKEGGRKPAPDFTRLAIPELIAELLSNNAWRRETAQRLLVERRDTSAVAPLAALACDGAMPQARLHALGALDGLSALDQALIERALTDAHPAVRLHALRWADPWLNRKPALLERILALVDDPDAKVRLQVAFTLGETQDERRWAALAKLAAKFAEDRWMQSAIMSSTPESETRLLRELLEQGAAAATPALVRQLASVTGARREKREVEELLEIVVRGGLHDATGFQTNSLSGLIEGLRRGKASQPDTTYDTAALRQIVSSPSAAVRAMGIQAGGLLSIRELPEMAAAFAAARDEALDSRRTIQQRKAAIALLASAPFEMLEPTARKLLDARQPLEVQLAAVAALGASDDATVTSALLDGWKNYSPKVHSAAIDAIFRRQQRLVALLDALDKQAVPRQALDANRRNQLLKNSDETIRNRAEVLFGNVALNPDPKSILQRYQAALVAGRDSKRGEKLFQEHCTRCHSLNGTGGRVGPDLAGTKGRAEETLLLDVLQPSEQITAGYSAYTIQSVSGELFTGVVSSETATSLTLPSENAADQTILRKDIESMQMSPISVMPDNFAELLRPQDVADILGYLREASRGVPSP